VGPTTVTLHGNQMTVLSKGTSATGANDTLNFASDSSTCPTDGSTLVSLPTNGVLFVDQGGNGNTGNNPFDGICSHGNCNDSQTLPGGCTGCYYGQTNSPDTEADAFVSGSLSGHLTVSSNQNVIITGPLTYADCTWVGTSSWSNCNYNSFTSSSAVNDTLGLIAYQYVEVNMPLDGNGNVLAACGSHGALAAPLCDPSTSSGAPNGGQGLTIDGSILALQGSFLVNNYQSGNNNTSSGNEGTLTIYGSLQQDARGAVGTFNGGSIQSGYSKRYLWDPRLPFYSPPYYLTPGTASWNLMSSAESYTGTCPTQPPAQSLPQTTQPTFNQSGGGWTTCSTP
jgi:hypothetical protein